MRLILCCVAAPLRSASLWRHLQAQPRVPNRLVRLPRRYKPRIVPRTDRPSMTAYSSRCSVDSGLVKWSRSTGCPLKSSSWTACRGSSVDPQKKVRSSGIELGSDPKPATVMLWHALDQDQPFLELRSGVRVPKGKVENGQSRCDFFLRTRQSV